MSVYILYDLPENVLSCIKTSMIVMHMLTSSLSTAHQSTPLNLDTLGDQKEKVVEYDNVWCVQEFEGHNIPHLSVKV